MESAPSKPGWFRARIVPSAGEDFARMHQTLLVTDWPHEPLSTFSRKAQRWSVTFKKQELLRGRPKSFLRKRKNAANSPPAEAASIYAALTPSCLASRGRWFESADLEDLRYGLSVAGASNSRILPVRTILPCKLQRVVELLQRVSALFSPFDRGVGFGQLLEFAFVEIGPGGGLR